MPEPRSPMQVINMLIVEKSEERFKLHNKMVNEAVEKINNVLPKVCTATTVGVPQSQFVHLPNITHEALLEVILLFRAKGWDIHCIIDYHDNNCPVISVNIPL